MVQVYLDENSLPAEVANLSTVGELIEYVKSTIDQSTIIVSLTKDDEPLSDSDWKRSLSSLKDSTVDIRTGSKFDFMKTRLSTVGDLVDAIVSDLAQVSELFKASKSVDANAKFPNSLEDLNALMNWMYSILSMDPETLATEVSEFSAVVKELKYACGQMQQQQLFQSWWALGETIDKKITSLLGTVKEIGVRAENKVQ